MLRIFCSLTLGALMVTMSGCGGSGFESPVPVSGKVTFRGEPVEGARVTFHAQQQEQGAPSASGRTDAQGNFRLTTFRTGDGAIPGEYTITISKVETTMGDETDVAEGQYGADYGAMMEGAAQGVDLAQTDANVLPARYARPAESGLNRTVVEGRPNEFEIDLD